jgi:redox-sensitive bicupin YhaK (pirin superfamily)
MKVIGPEGGDVVKVHQDAAVYIASLSMGTEVIHPLGDDRGVYAYLIEGDAELDSEALTTGDAARVTDQLSLTIRATAQSEFIFVDVPMRFEPVGIWKGRI